MEQKTASGIVVVGRAPRRAVAGAAPESGAASRTHADRIKAGRAKVANTFRAIASTVGVAGAPEEAPEERGATLDGMAVLATVTPGRKKPPKAKRAKKAPKGEQPEEVRCHGCLKAGADRRVELKDGRGRPIRTWWFHDGACLDEWKRKNPPANRTSRRAAMLATLSTERRVGRRLAQVIPIDAKRKMAEADPIQITHRPDRCVRCQHRGSDVMPVPAGRHRDHRAADFRYLCARCAAPHIERVMAAQARPVEYAQAV